MYSAVLPPSLMVFFALKRDAKNTCTPEFCLTFWPTAFASMRDIQTRCRYAVYIWTASTSAQFQDGQGKAGQEARSPKQITIGQLFNTQLKACHLLSCILFCQLVGKEGDLSQAALRISNNVVMWSYSSPGQILHLTMKDFVKDGKWHIAKMHFRYRGFQFLQKI